MKLTNPTDGKVELFINNSSLKVYRGEIKVYDLSGKQVMIFNDVKMATGKSISLDLTNLQSGTYFINLSSDSFNNTKKVVIHK